MPLNHIVRGILEAVRPGPPAKPRIGSGAIGVDAATGRPRESSGLGVAILDKLTHQLATDPKVASDRDWLAAVSLAVRDIVADHWLASSREPRAVPAKQVCYLSLEFLIGRLLRDAVSNLGLTEEVQSSLDWLGAPDLTTIAEHEPDAALGNGGLGRLAACFMESMATLDIPAIGYGVRYRHGLFRQNIEGGQQTELPEDWLERPYPWEVERVDVAYEIPFGGSVVNNGGGRAHWNPGETLQAVAYDIPIAGWKGKRVNTLRLWQARAIAPLELQAFNNGDHVGAQRAKAIAEAITLVLYPSDANPAGHELRLRQEYFFTSASIQDLLTRHIARCGDLHTLPQRTAIQMNDTHPAIAVAELMRQLIDVHAIAPNEAWEITRGTLSYTNHTLLPEALESWPVHLIERMLPRHMQLIYDIDARIEKDLAKRPESDRPPHHAVSVIERNGDWRVRMGHLAFVGSHKINGVSALHTDLMRSSVFRDLDRVYPGRIVNKTNGITPRRWLQQANPGLTRLVRDAIGDKVLDDAEGLLALDRFASDASFQERFAGVKHANKLRLSRVVMERLGLSVDPNALFDIQVKRIHEYKRQLLNILETIALAEAIRANPNGAWVPRVRIFAGKAAASYVRAKEIVRLINDVAASINSDPTLRGLLKVAFLPNYNVSLAEVIVPAADLSEQISTAGMEASGTGNMKFAINGALTIGTLDGANIEMKEHVGSDNIVIFGLTAEEVAERRRAGIDAGSVIDASPRLKGAIHAISSGAFSQGDGGRYRGICDSLRSHDWFMVAFDFGAYADAQRRIDGIWSDRAGWQAKAIHNVARMGWFSSDRTIRDYADDIWKVHVGHGSKE